MISEGKNFATFRNPEACRCFVVGSRWFLLVPMHSSHTTAACCELLEGSPSHTTPPGCTTGGGLQLVLMRPTPQLSFKTRGGGGGAGGGSSRGLGGGSSRGSGGGVPAGGRGVGPSRGSWGCPARGEGGGG